ncbi:MAG: 50S ribosomal protein L17 [Clostridiales bacterium]|nr:50S ribosomal protein L17 [Clostridiales bacterium]
MTYRKLGVKSAHRRAMMRNLATSLIKDEKVQTTEPRAKELRGYVEKMITLGKKGDLASRRRALAFLTEEVVVGKLFSDLAKRYQNRAGGYTRLIRLEQRRGDSAQMVLVELV